MENKLSKQANTECDCCSVKPGRNPADWFKTIHSAGRAVFRRRNSRYLFFPLAAVLYIVFIFIPILSIPGNTLQLQLSLLTLQDQIVLILLAFLGSLLLLMHIYNYRNRKTKKKANAIASGSFGSISGIGASIFGAASCPMCVASLFGFLGLGAVGFLVNYQWIIFGVSAFFVLISLYFASKKAIFAHQNHE